MNTTTPAPTPLTATWEHTTLDTTKAAGFAKAGRYAYVVVTEDGSPCLTNNAGRPMAAGFVQRPAACRAAKMTTGLLYFATYRAIYRLVPVETDDAPANESAAQAAAAKKEETMTERTYMDLLTPSLAAVPGHRITLDPDTDGPSNQQLADRAIEAAIKGLRADLADAEQIIDRDGKLLADLRADVQRLERDRDTMRQRERDLRVLHEDAVRGMTGTIESLREEVSRAKADAKAGWAAAVQNNNETLEAREAAREITDRLVRNVKDLTMELSDTLKQRDHDRDAAARGWAKVATLEEELHQARRNESRLAAICCERTYR